ncbi:glycosyltransferase family 4 protein [Leptotrichia sp. oral taxon 417]|jgi:hexosyltransferase|uniref:glycosyltransferase family 4 protein n=1 Tax=Leptotrichia sp. oral taxon 417 TaxID=712365 RepID=UPI0015BD14B2|nr:glycosyltransferase family 4 protein [Leptotrichia sp. oral taxon 417]NWO26314.1 glycosyltransferase family 4 protein [Leptotrichia sp. oral taxon 417]
MKKIAFVVPWYGDKIPGGAETELRGLIKDLQKNRIELEVLTTCVEKFVSDWNKNYYEPGDYVEDRIKIKRFKVRKRDTKKFDKINFKLMNNQKITTEEEQKFFEEMVRSVDLENYIEKNMDDYSLFCFIPYMFGTTYYGVKKSKKKAVIIPCLHDESYAYMETIKEIFNISSASIFHAKPEQELAKRLYGMENVKTPVLGEGLDFNIPDKLEGVKEKYNLKNPYILYAGRKDEGKNVHLLLKYFSIFKEKNASIDLDLVLIGGGEIQIPKNIKENVHDLGFVSIDDKYRAYANSLTLIQPSINESFSIVIMESWAVGTPVIVNDKCEVTKNFAIESNGGLYFNNYFEFEEILKFYINNPNIANKMGQNGKEYVFKNFDREIVTKKYIDFFKELVGEKD